MDWLKGQCLISRFERGIFLPVSGMAPVIRFASSPRTLAITLWGELEPPKKAPPNFDNRAESPPLEPSEESTVLKFVN